MKSHHYTPKSPDTTGWKLRHLQAMAEPFGTMQGNQRAGVNGLERALVIMLRGWLEYAESYKARFESEIGDDYVLGNEWFAIGVAMLSLLNGDLGRLDGGTLDAIIRDNLTEQGFDCDLGERRKK
jgi:hypothetical protein